MATEAEIVKVWTVLINCYPYFGKDKSAGDLKLTLGIYERLLADIPADVLEAAAMQHIASAKFFPTVAELRDLAAALVLPPPMAALEAWGELRQKAIVEWNRYTDNGHMPWPTFSDPLIGHILAVMGGPQTLQDSTFEAADRARFLELYEELAQRRRQEAMLLPQARELHARLAGGQPPAASDSRLAALVGRVADARRLQ